MNAKGSNDLCGRKHEVEKTRERFDGTNIKLNLPLDGAGLKLRSARGLPKSNLPA